MIDSWINAFYNALGSIGYTHPVHPTMVHMPIGLVTGALILAFAALWTRGATVALAARYCLIVAFIFYFPTVTLGLMDWQHFLHGAWLFPIEMKMILAGLLLIFLSITLFLNYRLGAGSKALLPFYVLCFCCVVGLGYFGGQLVYGGKSQSQPAAKGYKAGEQVFSANCSGCHPHGGNVIKPNMPLKNSNKLTDYKTFLNWIRNPKSPMPPFSANSISEQKAHELYQYIVHVIDQSSGNAGGKSQSSANTGGKSQAPAQSYQAGEQVYANNCNGCHPHGGNVMNPKAPVKNSNKLVNYKTFLNWIRNPKSPMPPFPAGSIADSQAHELYQYIVHVIDQSGSNSGGK